MTWRFATYAVPGTGPADPVGRHLRERAEQWLGRSAAGDEFRFHLTVTDRIPAERRPDVERALRGWFGASLGATVAIGALALFTEAGPGPPFTLHSVHPLRPGPSSPSSRRHGGQRSAVGAADSEGAA